MALSEKVCRDAKPQARSYQLSDGNGLALEVRPTGRKYWIARLRHDGREVRRSLGVYPVIPLKEARRRNAELRDAGVTPESETFRALAEEWFTRRVEGRLADSYSSKIRYRLDGYILPALGGTAIRAVSAPMVLELCRAIEDAGTLETAHRVRQIVGQIMRYGIASGRCDNDPTPALYGALAPREQRHYPTLTTPEDIQRLVRAVYSYPYPVLHHALIFSLLTFARPGEVRKAEWSEIEGDTWRVPAMKMKMGRVHLVPLCSQVLDSLQKLRLFTGHQNFLFPSPRKDGRPMSENGVRAALRSLGFRNDEISPHGIRGMASTILHEAGWPSEVIELQLAHVDRNRVRASYNHAERLAERREMMKWWGDFVEGKAR